MEQNQINLSQVSDIQLKAFAYDELGKIEMAQNNLRIINQELASRSKTIVSPINNAFINTDIPLVK